MPYSRLFYHFVWATKERLPLITKDNREALYAAIAAKVKGLNGLLHAINGTEDHIHLVVTLPTTLSLSTFIGQVKGSSSHLLSNQGQENDIFAWQSGYGVISISEASLPTIVRYVQLQQEHHAEKTINPRLESWDGD